MPLASNEDLKRRIRDICKLASPTPAEAEQFSFDALRLLRRGYQVQLGTRGGISFEFVGVGEYETRRKEIADAFYTKFHQEID